MTQRQRLYPSSWTSIAKARAGTTPLIGDFHYNGHLLLRKYPECARALAKYRINPGNVSIGRKDDDNFRTMIEVRGRSSASPSASALTGDRSTRLC